MIAKDFEAVAAFDTDVNKDNQGNWPFGFRFGVACDAVIMAPDKSSATFKAIAAGQSVPCQGRRVVSATAGVATDIIALYESDRG